jgi:RNA polymerase sigma factor (sigma-70 family)
MGDEDRSRAFPEFCNRVHSRLVGALSLYCGDAALAEEFAQEALARAFRDWRKVGGLDNPEGWVFRTGFNITHSYFRRRAAERRANDRARMQENAFLDAEDVRSDAVALRSAVARLPRRQRTAVVLRFYADYSVSDVARLMECPEGTVKTLTRKALSLLRLQPEVQEFKEVPHVR